MPRPADAGNKYHAKRSEVEGRGMASGIQGEVFATLKQMERGGLISNIRHEQSIQLMPSVKHRIDFIVFEHARTTDVGIEAKWDNKKDGRWQTLKQVYRDLAPIPVQIWMKNGRRVSMYEEIPVGKYRIVEK
jgi:predicted component of type VI protein secretion system